jgi:Beta-propeller repeat
LNDAFVTKLSPSGSALVFSTYLGGSSREEGKGIAVDSSGNAYVTGTTSSGDFPTANPFQAACNQCGSGYPFSRDAFIAKIKTDGSALLYSTYLGGAGDDVGNAIALNAAGEATVAGYTQSTNFPTARPFQANLKGVQNAFVTKLDVSGKNLLYSTYLGGSSAYYGDGTSGVAVDSSGNVILTGYAGSTDFPISPNAFQTTRKGNPNAFVSQLSSDGSVLLFSTYLGGSVSEEARAVAVDAAGNIYLTGDTCSSDFPLKDPLQADVGRPNIYRQSCDVFLTKLNPSQPGLQYSTYLGGKSLDTANGIAVDSSSNVYLTGTTGSLDFPLVSPLQSGLTGTVAPFVAKISEGDRPLTATLFVPIVLSAAGVNHSFYTTELTLTNRGAREAKAAAWTACLPDGSASSRIPSAT